MYDMYPDWGPSRHREPVDTLSRGEARAPARNPHLDFIQDSLDKRDDSAQRPDDN